MDKTKQFEALVHILWDQEEKQYLVHVPRQTVSKVSVHAELKNEMDPSRYVHVMDIHSHNNMPAQFSAIDDQDEKATRLYAVIGRLDQYWPAISVRLSNGGKYMDVPPRTVFAGYGQPSFPGEWEKNICKSPQRRRQKNLRLYLQRSGGGKE